MSPSNPYNSAQPTIITYIVVECKKNTMEKEDYEYTEILPHHKAQATVEVNRALNAWYYNSPVDY